MYNGFIAKKIESLITKDDLHLLVTDQLNKKLPIYSWYNYKHSYSEKLVLYLFKALSIKKDSNFIVLDPFCGAGTTLLAAKKYGIESIGIDVMPFSVFISKAKTENYNIDILNYGFYRLDNHLNNFSGIVKQFQNKKLLLKSYFSNEILDWVLYVYSWIVHQHDNSVRLFFMTALFAIIENISQMKKDGGFLRKYTRKIDIKTAKDIFFKQIENMIEDLVYIKNSSIKPNIILDDIRCLNIKNHYKIPRNSIDVVITSPPYPNRHDYTRIYGLESILGFSNKASDIKKIRYNTLRSHVEAKKSYTDFEYKALPLLNKIINDVKKQSLPNREVIPMLEGYFEDIYNVLKKLYFVLKIKGFLSIVVCDVRYGGIVVPVGELINEYAQSLGFSLIFKTKARNKNNSSQQMKIYGKQTIGEYIFIWQK